MRIDRRHVRSQIKYLVLPVFRVIPVKTVRLQDVGEAGLVGEEKSEVGGEDAVLHVAQHLLVLLGPEPAQDVAAVLLSAANRLIGEVVQSRRRPLLGPSPG